MDSLQPYSTLRCLSCGGERFLPVLTLTRNPKTGLVQTPAGHACLQCQAVVNVQHMIEHDEVERMERELQERQAALAARRAPTAIPLPRKG